MLLERVIPFYTNYYDKSKYYHTILDLHIKAVISKDASPETAAFMCCPQTLENELYLIRHDNLLLFNYLVGRTRMRDAHCVEMIRCNRLNFISNYKFSFGWYSYLRDELEYVTLETSIFIESFDMHGKGHHSMLEYKYLADKAKQVGRFDLYEHYSSQ
jgi:hypothetical protein